MRNRKKVLILNSYPYIGGAEKFISGLTEGLKQESWTVFLGLRAGSKFFTDLARNQRNVFPLPLNADFDPPTIKILYRLIRENHIPLMFATDERTARVAGTLHRLLPHTHSIARLRSVWNPKNKEKKLRHLRYKIGYRLFLNWIVTNSEAGKQDLVQGNWFPEKRIQVIYNGINLNHLSRFPVTYGKFRNRLGIPRHAFLISILARICPPKNQLLVFEIAAHISQYLSNCYFVIAGRPVDRKYFKLLKAKQAKSAFAKHIFLLEHQEAVAQLLTDSDLILSPSLEEGLPNVFIEAGYLGKPVIARDICGNGEIIQHNVNGILLDSDAGAPSYAEAILELYHHPDWRQRMAQNARKIVEQKFSYSAMIENYIRFFLEVMEQSIPVNSEAVERIG